MKLWFPGRFTEAHRKPAQGWALTYELERLGVEVTANPDRDCDYALCGSIWLSKMVSRVCRERGIPCINYNWDLYPWQVEGKAKECLEPENWGPYVEELKTCRDIWVPSQCVVERTRQFTGREAVVIKTAVHLWTPEEVWNGGYVVDVIRQYPDPNCKAIADACDALGIQCVETGGDLPLPEFRKLIAGAGLLASGYYEASTGGLTLLEGYALGKPVLLADSPYNGSVDYFEDRAQYFTWDSTEGLMSAIIKALDDKSLPPTSVDYCRQWVEYEYSNAAMARRMVARLKELYATDHR